MGCISSKITTRSISFREELDGSLHSRINGVPLLEDFLISKNKGDQLLALVCTANVVANKLQTTSQSQLETNEYKPFEQTNPETINTRELMTRLEEQWQQQQQQSLPPTFLDGEHNNVGIANRDFHNSEQQNILGRVHSFPSSTSNIAADSSAIESLIRSRSIHTVEEYDALVRASHGQLDQVDISTVNLEECNTCDVFKKNGPFGTIRFHQYNKKFDLEHCDVKQGCCAEFEDSKIKVDDHHLEICRSSSECPPKSTHISMDKDANNVINVDQAAPQKEDFQEALCDQFEYKNSDLSTSIAQNHLNEDSTKNVVSPSKEKRRFRRKLKTKELTTLSIPSTTFDFPVTGSIGDMLEPGGKVFNSHEYITPRFGNFNLPITIDSDSAFFDPEIVAAFEDAMRQFTEEEEYILKQIDETVEKDENSEQVGEEVLSCTY